MQKIILYPLNENTVFGIVAIFTDCLKDHSMCFCSKMNRSQDHSSVVFLSFSRKNAAAKDHSRPWLFAIVLNVYKRSASEHVARRGDYTEGFSP